MSRRADYGIDAPMVVRNLALGGAIALIIALFRYDIHIGSVTIEHSGWWFPAIGMGGTAIWMWEYSRFGKLRMRDRIIRNVKFQGDETVLDVGTGRGLMLIGAARKLTTGRAIGTDIWSGIDLAGNSREETQRNIDIEGVTDRCELRSDPAQALVLPDASVDVVLSTLCLHNIPSRADRDKACDEIARVLKPGGRIAICDFIKTRDYIARFQESGLTITSASLFPYPRVIYATKKA